jgi:hypothetical protein
MSKRFAACALLPALMNLSLAVITQAESKLTVINPPEGGRVIYGQIPGESTESGGMGWILRSLRKEFDDRPRVGKLFQVRGTESVAAFFSLTNHINGNAQLNGLLIVIKPASDRVEGAVVYDQASKFAASFNPLMKALFQAWHPVDSVRTASAGGSGSPAAATLPPMHKFVTSDQSASVELPEDWTPDPGSAGGSIAAKGPNGERIFLGFATLASDTRNPSVQRTLQTLRQGGLAGTAYANAFYYAYDADLGKMFQEVMQFNRKRRNMPAATIDIESATALQAGPSQRCAHIKGHLDGQDGTGKRELNGVFSAAAPSRFGSFLTSASFTSVPVAFADKERPMLGAVLASFEVNQAIVQQQANAYAAPAINAIHEIGKRAAIQAKAAHEANDIHNSSVYQRWDDQDKRSKEFENYQLGYTVVKDTPNNAHGTLWNEDADRLVKQDPQRFEYVNAPDFWKGIDY